MLEQSLVLGSIVADETAVRAIKEELDAVSSNHCLIDHGLFQIRRVQGSDKQRPAPTQSSACASGEPQLRVSQGIRCFGSGRKHGSEERALCG